MDLKDILQKDLAPLAREVITESISDAAAFKFDKHHPQHLSALCVYCTLIELARSELTLLENGDVTAMPAVLRTIFEAYADLRAILEDPDYYKNMYATFLEEKFRFLRNVERSASNPFLIPIAGRLDVKSELVKLEQERQEHKSAGRPPLSTAARFRAAKLEHEYESMYWLLCLEGHNNMSALDDRHIEKTGDEFEVLRFKDAGPDDLVRLLDALAAVVTDGTIRLHAFLDTGLHPKYRSIQERLAEIRGEYPPL